MAALGKTFEPNVTDPITWAVLPKTCKLAGDSTSINDPSKIGTAHWMVVTSPLETTIPEIITGYQEYRFRKDGQPGLQCRTQYPQFITTDFEWATCIPKSLDPSSPIRFTPTLEDCPIVPCTAINIELRLLSSSHWRDLHLLTVKASERAQWFLTNFPQHNELAETRNTLFQRLRMLGVTNTFPQILIAVAGLQRSLIDLHAIIDYETIYRPRLRAPEFKIHPLDPTLMGGITESEEEAFSMAAMGIPFYLIRPAYQLVDPSMTFGQEVHFEPPSPLIVLADYDPPFTPLFQGYPHRDMQRAGQRLRLNWADFLAPSCIITHQEYNVGESSTGPVGEPSTGPVRSRVEAPRISPYPQTSTQGSSVSSWSRRRSAHPPQTSIAPAFNASKFLTPETSFFPPMVDYWKQALLLITPNPSSSLRATTHIGYTFPDPHIFTNDYNRTAYLLTWIGIRFAQFFNVDRCSKGCDTVTSQQWKLGLNTFQGLLQPTSPPPTGPNLPPPVQTQTNRKKGSRRDKGQYRTLNTYLDELLALFKHTPNVQWFGQTFPVSTPDAFTTSLPPSVSAEIIWEVTELSFRRELREVDAHLLPHIWKLPTKATKRDELVRCVFPLDHGVVCPAYTLLEYPNNDEGLLSPLLTERARAIMAFRQLASSRPRSPPALRETRPVNTEDEVAALEKQVAVFYCQIFHDCFGRPPIVPHRLPPSARQHNAPRSYNDHIQVDG
ncbi:hypothetical protein BKA70DRAFT_1423628 [Coprinopsis sp. MPI-PUGE-AT-0042]|nr:hypothetical protein BKA70DRAFT_1423628 [Coprinopsis sp. MPI-PUGE-AT-0042]